MVEQTHSKKKSRPAAVAAEPVAQTIVSGAGARRVDQDERADERFMNDPLWFKDAVIYQIHIKSYFDANRDGIGDFAGLVGKLDYIAGLGVNTIWLLPFYPSPRRDDGYDIAQYKAVHPDYGTLADARRFLREAHRRGLRVVTELVINHTSDQHPWFQRARHAKKGSAARDFYVWSDSDQGYSGTRIIFCDTEKSNWTWDPVAQQYYWHRFYSHQPDLNFDNPKVFKAVTEVMNFWLDLGVDGLRLDAVPYLIEREGTTNENLPETHEILKRLRSHIDTHYPGRMLLAEANMWPEDVQQYFGDGDECHLAFHFPLMPRMYMALAQQDRFPMTDILRQTPEIPEGCQWAIFLRNHDELTLEMVTDRERDYLWRFYSPDRRARINLGIRRRLAPLMERDRRRIELLNSFLLSMPGTPVIYYGDEIGMGDNIHLNDRDGVRTPMQWSPDRNGGFSRADPARLVLPAIMDAQYGYEAVNVEAQSSDPYSLLNWMRRMLAVRKQHRAFGRGKLMLLYPANRKIFAYLREHDATAEGGGVETILCVANVSQSVQPVELDLSPYVGRVPVEMLGGTAFAPVSQAPYSLTLPPFGFFWFALAQQAQLPSWYEPQQEPLPDYVTLVFRKRVEEMLEQPLRGTLEREVLPRYLQKRFWFYGSAGQRLPGTDVILPSARILSVERLPGCETLPQAFPVLLVRLSVETVANGKAVKAEYQLPLGFILEQNTVTSLPSQLALSRARRNRDVGLLTDAFTLDSLPLIVIEQLSRNAKVPISHGALHFRGEAGLSQIRFAENVAMRRVTQEQTNSSVIVDDQVVVKVLRRIHAGIHPEAEIGRYLTLRGYPNAPEFLGELVRVEQASDDTEVAATLQLVHRFVHNQSDAWEWVMHTLERQIQRALVFEGEETAARIAEEETELLLELTEFSSTLGKRLAELHAVLALPTDEPAFAPERAGAQQVEIWRLRASEQIVRALDLLEQQTRHVSHDSVSSDRVGELADAAQLAALRQPLLGLVDRLTQGVDNALMTRLHGNLHLGQVLMVQDDVWFIDFEGEASLTLEQRRVKSSPWQDVAGLLRSFDYVAAYARNVGAADLGEAGERRKRSLLRRFVPACQQAFLEAYVAHGSHGSPTEVDMALLDLYSLEKAAYEVCFDAANRPAWLPVPVSGLLRMARRIFGLRRDSQEGDGGDALSVTTFSPSDLLRAVLARGDGGPVLPLPE